MTKKLTIYFQGNTQFENTGDVLINKSLLEIFRSYGNIVVNDQKLPDYYKAALKLKKEEFSTNGKGGFYQQLFGNAFNSIFRKGHKVMMVAGPPGHIFGNSKKKIKKNLEYSVFLFLLKIMGVKIIRLGFSMGPVGQQQALSERIRSWFTDHYLVRDSISLQLAHRIGINKAQYFPDLAWMYSANGVDLSLANKNEIIFSFRDSIYKDDSGDTYQDKLINSLIYLMDHLKDRFRIKITYQVLQDYAFCKALFDNLSKRGYPVSFVEEQITLENAGEAYKDGVAIITNRLHGALLAAKYDVLPIVLTDVDKHLKIKGIYVDAGLEELLIDASLSNEALMEKINLLLLKRESIIKKLDDIEKQYHSYSTESLKKIMMK
ncbi:polysaccharide pyruvyl transferase family protein [Echinicola sp. CAU 1574]|uniref:Polysaccharide pyruvyl transferase family protein n=1 Tax=Echinicola arenosa TaxID=2774144 RepID=A0ABR9ASK9_9BACT|nr:polysaccharide pyruvyl transferase family protein [Echinicola arenosa]MBD8490895.1 polysaccharide pyruvyl transferase family protein [Echinicola arenosa]